MASFVAQDVFQRELDAIFLDVPGVTGIDNDMIIYGKYDLKHDGNLLNFLEVCRKNNLTINAEKMQFRLPQVFSLDTPRVTMDCPQIQRK